VELRTFIEQAIEVSRPQIDAADHSLAVDLPPQSVVIEGDPARLTQVFANLLNNAARYTERNGSILMRAVLDPANNHATRMVAVSVRDSGIGIAPEKLPRIFDMFFQADSGKDRGQGGLGIGLTLARRLIEMHGGTIQVKSDGLNKGSEFIVRLPVSAVGVAVAPAERVEVKAQPAPSRTRVAIVDDNKMQAQTLAMLLEIMGYEVRTAHDGQTGLQLISDFDPQAALIDIGLPGTDGYDVARRLRGLERHKGMLLIAQTGWGRQEDREQSRAAGFDHHLAKPIDHEQLAKILTQAADGGKMN
jgi:two-component system CheB/CheR fusion protein